MKESNKQRKSAELSENYQNEKVSFLDDLHPNDFRNGASFNQAELIVETLNKAMYSSFLKKENPEEFIKKAALNLFRQDSPAIAKLMKLSRCYLELMES